MKRQKAPKRCKTAGTRCPSPGGDGANKAAVTIAKPVTVLEGNTVGKSIILNI